eukprot:m.232932 g.232932  ORF g.232932 m.232932 type:complete len:974 (-) comp26076_c0_seq4:174-3095(-)
MASHEGIRLKDVIESQTERLVRWTLGDSDADLNNVVIACEFAAENFRLHSFLDPNSHALNRTVEGLADKFDVCSQEVKADELRRLRTELISQAAVFRDGVDTAYSILSLLLELSESPTHAEYEPPLPPVAITSVDADIHSEESSDDTPCAEAWSEYESDNSADWVLDSDSDDGEATPQHPREAAAPDASSSAGRSPVPIPMFTGSRGAMQPLPNTASMVDPYGAVRSHLIEPYFNDDARGPMAADAEAAAAAAHAAAIGIGTIWEHMTPGPQPSEGSRVVDEACVVRETCWMLSGLDTPLYTTASATPGTCIRFQAGWRVAGTSVAALQSATAEFVHVGTQLIELRRFVSEHGGVVATQAGTRTHKALACSYQQRLVQLDRRVSGLERTTSLRRLGIELNDDMARIRALAALHRDAVGTTTTSLPSERVARVLDVLYSAAFRTELVSESAAGMAECALSLFVDTATPLFGFLDRWMQDGVLDDAHDEFPIVVGHPHHTDPHLLPLWERSSLRHDSTAAGAARNIWTATQKRYLYCPGMIPQFLHRVLQQLLVGGKSAQMLRVSGVRQPPQRETLATFLDALHIRSDERVDPPRTAAAGSLIAAASAIRFPRETEAEQLLVDVVLDIFKPLPVREADRLAGPRRSTTSAGTAGLTASFEGAITNGYLNASNTFLSVLNVQFHLLEHLQIMREFYLLGAGGFMHPVCTGIFSTVPTLPGASWNRAAEYTDMLQQALADAGHAQHRHRISAVIPQRCPSTPIEAVRALRMLYQVPALVELVIDRAAQHVYAESFAFLMQLKWSKWMLNNVDTQRSFAPSSGSIDTHKALLLRSRILHAVDAVQSYLLSRLFDHLSVDFQGGLANARDLDDICRLHANYIASVREHCLLGRQVTMVRNAIVKIADMGVRFRRMWDGMTSRVVRRGEDARFAGLDRDFQECCKFLTKLLRSVVKNGAYSHMQPLLDALQTCTTPPLWG